MVWILGPDGSAVSMIPRSPPPLCPDGLVPMPPRQELASGARFDGVLYTIGQFPSQSYAAAPGTYTVIASFSYRTGRDGPWTQLTRTATFDWAE